MRTHTVTHLEPSGEANPQPEGDALARQVKQRETMNCVLANSLVNQLLQSGCGEGDVINLATQILHYVTNHGFGNGASRTQDESRSETPLRVDWRLTPADHGRHVIHGERVTLRPLESSHLPFLRTWREDGEIQRTCSSKLLAEVLRRNGRRREDHREFVIHDESETPIGLMALFHIDPDSQQAEVAKLLGDPAARGRGYATESTGLLLSYAFQVLELHRVYLRTKGFNLQNIELNEKLGFQYEGILRASERLQGELIDVVLMSMLAREYTERYHTRELPEPSIAVDAPAS